MARINLLTRKKHQLLRKHANSPYSQDATWLICCIKNDNVYFLQHVEEKTQKVVWSKSRDKALRTYTERGAYTIIDAYHLRSREGLFIAVEGKQ